MQISVRVAASAKKDSIEVLKDGRLRISVRAKAEAGAANERVVELVARHFRVSAKAVRIVRGRTTPSKLVEVKN